MLFTSPPARAPSGVTRAPQAASCASVRAYSSHVAVYLHIDHVGSVALEVEAYKGQLSFSLDNEYPVYSCWLLSWTHPWFEKCDALLSTDV